MIFANVARSNVARAFAAAGAFAILGGCVESQVHVGQDFGVAVRQDVAAQVADPQPAYLNKPAPASDGDRAALAQHRYQTGQVIQPAAAAASTIGMSSGGSGAGVGASASAGPGPQ